MAPIHGDKDGYLLSRDDLASLRLTAQHDLFTKRTGGLLHSRVKDHLMTRQHAEIADIGCGNGVWLFEMADHFPDVAKFVGLDISLAMVPLPKEWPANCTFETLNLAGQLPNGYVAGF